MQNVQRLRERAREVRVREAQERAQEILRKYSHGPLRCECCGFQPLQHARLVNNRLLGPECSRPGHAYPCNSNMRRTSQPYAPRTQQNSSLGQGVGGG